MTIQEFRKELQNLKKSNDDYYNSVIARVSLACFSGSKEFVKERINRIAHINMDLWTQQIITDLDEYKKHCAPINDIRQLFNKVD